MNGQSLALPSDTCMWLLGCLTYHDMVLQSIPSYTSQICHKGQKLQKDLSGLLASCTRILIGLLIRVDSNCRGTRRSSLHSNIFAKATIYHQLLSYPLWYGMWPWLCLLDSCILFPALVADNEHTQHELYTQRFVRARAHRACHSHHDHWSSSIVVPAMLRSIDRT
jgi:hypothetical protein